MTDILEDAALVQASPMRVGYATTCVEIVIGLKVLNALTEVSKLIIQTGGFKPTRKSKALFTVQAQPLCCVMRPSSIRLSSRHGPCVEVPMPDTGEIEFGSSSTVKNWLPNGITRLLCAHQKTLGSRTLPEPSAAFLLVPRMWEGNLAYQALA
jgi:hypothetical protein